MKKLLLPITILALAATLPLLKPVVAQDAAVPAQHDHATLKKALEDLGFSVKMLVTDPGKEKYQIDIERDSLNLPIGVELSPSKSYIWITLNLGASPNAETAAASKFADLLKANTNIQPSQFYITKSGRLMIAIPIDNRYVTNATLRRCIDKVAGDVVTQKSTWQSAAQ